MFATDRDLLVLEPGLFNEVRWASQELLSDVDGVFSFGGMLLLIPSGELDLLGVAAGQVALIDGVAVEITSLTSALLIVVSKLRTDPTGPAIRVGADSALVKVSVMTFGPQIRLVHRQILAALGLVESGGEDAVTASMVVNADDLALVEALGALHLIYTSASALVGESSPLWVKAQMYAARFRDERRRVLAEIDLDGDGIADATRRINVIQLTRE